MCNKRCWDWDDIVHCVRTCYFPSCEYRGICSWPHGCCYSFLGIMSGFGAVYMNVTVIISCFLMRITMINPITGEQIAGSERGYGFRARETDYGLPHDYQQCSYYKQDEIPGVYDIWMKTSRFFTWAAGALGSICFFVYFFACCCAFSQNMFHRWLLWLYLVAAIFMGLCFLAFATQLCANNHCEMAVGTGSAISTFLFYLISCNSVKSMPAARPKTDPDEDEDDELADLYYEDENDKYPLPEMRPDRRGQYEYADRLAEEEGDYKEQPPKKDDDDEYEYEDVYEEYDEDDDHRKRDHDERRPGDGDYHDKDAQEDSFVGGPASRQAHGYDPHEDTFLGGPSSRQEHGYDDRHDDTLGGPSTRQDHGYDDPHDTFLGGPSAREQHGYEPSTTRPRVGDDDGPTIT